MLTRPELQLHCEQIGNCSKRGPSVSFLFLQTLSDYTDVMQQAKLTPTHLVLLHPHHLVEVV